jgi:hypothetical protein
MRPRAGTAIPSFVVQARISFGSRPALGDRDDDVVVRFQDVGFGCREGSPSCARIGALLNAQ